jgi:fucose permease
MNQHQRLRSIAAIYLSGLLIGVSLILFPSAGPLFRDPTLHYLSSVQFGVLFTPQTVTAIAAAFLAARLAARFGMKRVLLGGLGLALLALLLAVLSHFLIGSDLAFYALLAATGAVGAGFGLTITALNAYAFDLFPGKEDSAVTGIHVLTGIGQVGAALLLSVFTGGGQNPSAWWGAPLTIAVAITLMGLFLLTLRLRLRSESEASASPVVRRERVGGRVWVYALVMFMYGAVEGTFGNFTPLYLENGARLSMADAALGLSLFWGAVTAGRVAFALLALRINPKPLYYAAPVIVGAAFILLPTLNGAVPNYSALIAAGLALSFFFPYSVSLTSAENPLSTAAVSGALVAALQLGNGFSGSAVGIANESLSLASIFQVSVVYPVIMLAGILYLNLAHRMDQRLPCVALPCVQLSQKSEAS